MSTTEVHIASATARTCAAKVRVSVQQYAERDLDLLFGGKATFVLSTGACHVQTYMTRAEVADLILALQIARDELDALTAPVPASLDVDWAAWAAA